MRIHICEFFGACLLCFEFSLRTKKGNREKKIGIKKQYRRDTTKLFGIKNKKKIIGELG